MTAAPFSSTKGQYLVSSDKTLLSPTAINDALKSDLCYWAAGLPEDALEAMISSSYCLGLYVQAAANPGLGTPAKPKQIGFARMITDFVTFAYLTDVYVLPEEQGKGLGKWLINCVGEVLKTMPELRRALLITGQGRSEKLYGELLGARRMDPEMAIEMHILGPRALEYEWEKKHGKGDAQPGAH